MCYRLGVRHGKAACSQEPGIDVKHAPAPQLPRLVVDPPHPDGGPGLAEVHPPARQEAVERAHAIRVEGIADLEGQASRRCLSHPELRPEIIARAEPWLEFVESTLDKVLGHSPMAGMLPTKDLAYAFVSLYLGLNLMTHLEADRSRIDALFTLAERIAPTFSPLLGR